MAEYQQAWTPARGDQEPLAAADQQFGQREDRTGRAFFVSSLGINWAASARRFPFTFTVAEDLTAFNAQLALYRHSLWGWLGGMALLLLAAQALVLRSSLRPLRRVAVELSGIETGQQKRLEGRYPREIQRHVSMHSRSATATRSRTSHTA